MIVIVATRVTVFRPYDPVPEGFIAAQFVGRTSLKRSIILAETRRIIGEIGCAEVKMRSVAQKSNVTPPTLYSLIGSRHDLVNDALQEALEMKLSLAEKRSLIEDINPCLAFIETKIDAIENYGGFYRQVDRATRLSTIDASTVKNLYCAIERRFLKWLKILEQDGAVRARPCISLEKIARTLANQMAGPMAGWAAGEYGLTTLRSDLATTMALPLFAISTQKESMRINRWLDRNV